MRHTGILTRLFALGVTILVLTGSPLAQAPAGPGVSDALTVAGDIPTPLVVTVAGLKTYPRATVVVEEDGRRVTYEGTTLTEILKRAGAPTGAELRGNALASYLLLVARDGYQVVLSLAEVDPAFTKNVVIVADSIDGKSLFDYQGPLRLVIGGDTRPARSVRMLERIDVVRLRK